MIYYPRGLPGTCAAHDSLTCPCCQWAQRLVRERDHYARVAREHEAAIDILRRAVADPGPTPALDAAAKEGAK